MKKGEIIINFVEIGGIYKFCGNRWEYAILA